MTEAEFEALRPRLVPGTRVTVSFTGKVQRDRLDGNLNVVDQSGWFIQRLTRPDDRPHDLVLDPGFRLKIEGTP